MPVDDDFFGGLFGGFGKREKYDGITVNKYIKGLDKYTGRHLTSPDIDQKMKDMLNTQSQTWVSGGADPIETGTEYDGETVTCEKLKVDGIDVGATLKTLQERFLILEEDFEKHEQYPALKAAYEQYKIIEKLLQEKK